MTTIEQPAPSAVLAGDLRELIPFLSSAGQAREVVRRAAVLIETQADLLAINPPSHSDRLAVEQLAAHHEHTTNRCHICGWEHPTVRITRRRSRRGTR